jgi:MscS family membrane protein
MMKQWLSAINLEVENLWILGLIKAAIVVAVFTLLIYSTRFVIFKGLKRLMIMAHVDFNDHVLVTLRRLTQKILFLVAADLVFSCFPLPVRIADLTHHGVFIALVVIVLVGVFELTGFLSQYLFRLGASEFQPLVSKLFNIVAVLVGTMIVLRHFNYDIWHIVGALGIGSLAIGLAAQPTLSNMIAGFTLLIDRPFRPGDRIKLSSQESGDVIQIGMRSTQIRTLDGNMLVVPNSELSNSRVINFNFPTRQALQKLRFHFDPAVNLDDVKKTLAEANGSIEGLVPKSLSIFASGFNDRGIEITLNYEVENFSADVAVKDALIQNSLRTLRERQIKVVTGPGFPGH